MINIGTEKLLALSIARKILLGFLISLVFSFF